MSMRLPDSETRKERALRRLDTRRPICAVCGEGDWRCLEDHHIAGRKHHGDTAQICRNCHRKLSDAQKDHPASIAIQGNRSEIVGYYLLGLADLLLLIAERLTEFGAWLVEEAKRLPTPLDGDP